MAYIGNQQTEGYSQVPAKQDLTGATGTSLTLTHAVASAEGIDLFINNVRQEPTTAYSVGGDGVSVTLTGSVVATDDIYVVYNSLARQTSTHPSNQALQATTGTFSGDVTTTGDFKPTGKEYFHVDLTTAQSGLTSQDTVTVDLGGSGTVKYDTKSNFDSANDAYLLDSSDGVYLISFSIGVRSQTIASETIKDAAVMIRVATDGSTFTPIIGNGSHIQDSNGDEVGSMAFSSSFIYKATTATTKIDMQAYCDTATADNWSICNHVNNVTDNSPVGSSNARITFMSIARIA